MTYSHFRLGCETVYTEEAPPPDADNVKYCCRLCGEVFAEAFFAPGRKWQFFISHCSECDPKWGGSFFDIPDRALWRALPKAILQIELEQEVRRANIGNFSLFENPTL